MNYDGELLTIITIESGNIANIYINTPEDSSFYGEAMDTISFNQFDYIDIESIDCREWIEYVLDTLNKHHWDDCKVYSIMDACPELMNDSRLLVYH